MSGLGAQNDDDHGGLFGNTESSIKGTSIALGEVRDDLEEDESNDDGEESGSMMNTQRRNPNREIGTSVDGEQSLLDDHDGMIGEDVGDEASLATKSVIHRSLINVFLIGLW